MPDTTPDPAEVRADRPLDRFTVQTCPAGKHADWAADSENAHACPWCQIEKLDRDEDQLIGERDHLHEVADKLAYAIAPVEVIGEHSDHNDPWDNAYEELFNQRAARAAAVRAAAIREAAWFAQLFADLDAPGHRIVTELRRLAAAPTTTPTPEEG